jgi:hypothetical protein
VDLCRGSRRVALRRISLLLSCTSHTFCLVQFCTFQFAAQAAQRRVNDRTFVRWPFAHKRMKLYAESVGSSEQTNKNKKQQQVRAAHNTPPLHYGL